VLLPTQLLGVEREVELKCASVAVRDLSSVHISSFFDQSTVWTAQITHFE
jgi:hypothetical protein